MDDRIILGSDFDFGYEDLEISVPGISNDIILTRECWCVKTSYHSGGGGSQKTASKDCYSCDGTGIEITNNGKAILQLVKQFGGIS